MGYFHHVALVELSRDGDVSQPDAFHRALRVFQQVADQFLENYAA